MKPEASNKEWRKFMNNMLIRDDYVDNLEAQIKRAEEVMNTLRGSLAFQDKTINILADRYDTCINLCRQLFETLRDYENEEDIESIIEIAEQCVIKMDNMHTKDLKDLAEQYKVENSKYTKLREESGFNEEDE